MKIRRILHIAIRLLPLAAIAMVVLEVFIANRLVSMSYRLQNTEGTIRQLADENERLRQVVASASSLVTIEAQAKLLGFVPASGILSFSPEDFRLASLPKEAAMAP